MRQIAIRIARRGKQFARRVIDNPRKVERETSRIAQQISQSLVLGEGERHVLLASTGVRNIGDQAMLESFIANVPGEIDVLVTSSSTYVVPEKDRARVRMVTADALVYGRGGAQRSDLQQFVTLLSSARSFSVVGADVIDGGYQLRAPMMSWALAKATALAGLDTRILGFSWGAEVAPLIVRAAREANEAGVRLFARDPDSAARLLESGVPKVEEVVDTVFALGGEDAESAELETVRRVLEGGKKCVVLNVSGLIASRADLTEDYLAVARHISEQGGHLLLLPHVDNRGGSDIAAVRAFGKRLSAERIEHTLFQRLLRPKQVRAIASLSDAVVTGRMHLSILALSRGIPAIVLSTQGKVSGLMRRIGHPAWCVDPEVGMSARIIAGLDEALTIDKAELEKLVPGLSDLAERNFEGLS